MHRDDRICMATTVVESLNGQWDAKLLTNKNIHVIS